MIRHASRTNWRACAQMSGVPGPGSITGCLRTRRPTKRRGLTAPQSELQKATEYWGKEFARTRMTRGGAGYARNLKALGRSGRRSRCCSRPPLTDGGNRKPSPPSTADSRPRVRPDRGGRASSSRRPTTRRSPDWRVDLGAGHRSWRSRAIRRGHPLLRAGARDGPRPAVGPEQPRALAYAMERRCRDRPSRS